MALFESLEHLSLLDSSQPSPLSNQAQENKISERLFAAKIGGVHTDFFIQEFLNRVLIVATQLGKVASLVSVSKDPVTGFQEDSYDIYTVKTVFGSDPDQKNQLVSRFLYEHTLLTKPALFALGLKDHSPCTARAIRNIINTHKTW